MFFAPAIKENDQRIGTSRELQRYTANLASTAYLEFALDASITHGDGASRARREQTVGQSRKQRLLHAVRHAPAPVMLFDDDGRILLLNRAWRQAFAPPREMRRIEDWTAEARDNDGVFRYLRKVIETGQTNQAEAFNFSGKDGNIRRWSLIAAALGAWGTRNRLFVCIANDVTSDAGQQTTDRERHYRLLLEALPTAIYTTDANGRITFYNPAAATLWGQSPPLGSLWCGSWRLYWPDGRPMPHDQCPMAIALKENRAVRGAEAMAQRPDGTTFTFIPHPTPLHDAAGKLIGAVNMLIDISARKRAEKRLHLLACEVDHRAKNMLAIIQGLVRFTRADSVGEFASSIEGRIMALARAHSLLSDSGWDGADLKEIIEGELTPQRIADTKQVRIDGNSLILSPAIAQSLAMTLHELATNAARHGALTQPHGRVTVSWTVEEAGTLDLLWMETGAQSIQPPSRRGLGLNLIERTVNDQLEGEARFDWTASGLACRIQVPLRAPLQFAPAETAA